MKKPQLLVVDDEPRIRTLLRNCLEGDGFEITEADGAETAIAALGESDFDLVTLDLQLGADDGVDVAREIRKTSRVPIIMVTGKNDVIDRVVGLEIGADDYIVKPFHVREVLARVRAVLRRSRQNETAELPSGQAPESGGTPEMPFEFDGMIAWPDRFELRDRDGSLCDLTSGDFKLLNIFLTHPQRILSRDQLMDLTGGVEWTPLDRTIDNQVARLRKKIERDPSNPSVIKTVRGVGYSLACPVTRPQDQSRSSNSYNKLARSACR